jgi:hypothetical protein
MPTGGKPHENGHRDAGRERIADAARLWWEEFCRIVRTR